MLTGRECHQHRDRAPDLGPQSGESLARVGSGEKLFDVAEETL